MKRRIIMNRLAAVCAVGIGLLMSGCNLESESADGRIGVVTSPAGAEVYLNGALQGESPHKMSGLAPGEYVVELRKEGYARGYETLVLLEGRDVSLAVELEPLYGLLLVKSEPAGSDVLIAGDYKGKTPILVTDLPLGNYKVEFQTAGLPDRIERVALDSRVPEQVNIRHAPRVAVNSAPAGAEIFVDSQLVGVAPLVLSDLSEGEHRVEARMDLFDSQEKTVVLVAGLNEPVDFSLDKNSGLLVLDTEPSLVQVFVDGNLVATTNPKDDADSISQPLQLPLKAGVEHVIYLVREGYSSETFAITTEVDQMITRHDVLKRIFVLDTRITTASEVIDCRLEYKLPNGDMYYERAPGIYNTAKAGDILSVKPISVDDPSNKAARKQMELNRLNAPQL